VWHDARVPEAAPPDLTVNDLRGMKQLRRVAGLLSFLHEAGCGRDRAGNRELHFDDYVLLVLLYLFNPLIDSMRTLQKVAELPEVRKRLGIKRFSLGSFSESCRVFEPAMLRRVVDQLAAGLRPVGRHELLSDLPGTLTLVDSTVIHTLCARWPRRCSCRCATGPAATATRGGCTCTWTWTTTCPRRGS